MRSMVYFSSPSAPDGSGIQPGRCRSAFAPEPLRGATPTPDRCSVDCTWDEASAWGGCVQIWQVRHRSVRPAAFLPTSLSLRGRNRTGVAGYHRTVHTYVS